MATAQDKFKELVGEHIAPVLKEESFRRRDTTFRRQRDGAWQIVNFQRSQSSDSRKVRFVVNLGVALPELTTAEQRWHERGWPLEYECDFQARLGRLVKGEDHWWKVRPLKPVRPTARDVKKLLLEVGLPWLDLHSNAVRLLQAAVAEPSTVDFMNLHAFQRLAQAVGDQKAALVAARELASWERGER